MGQNLVLNLADHGWQVVAHNRTPNVTEKFVASEAAGGRVMAAYDLQSFVSSLSRPRRILLMIKAGAPVDQQIDALVPLLDQGDVIIDGGNSLYADSQRRCDALSEQGILFVGSGISGGEEGARWGASIMPGGNAAAWPLIEEIFTSIAAKAGDEPVADWVGPGGSGHFVKMVHNGIEYGDMQVIAEAYDVMRRGLGLRPKDQQPIFGAWNEGRLDSYLIGITADILAHTEEDGTPTVDVIVDAAGQKGTGKWTVVASMDHGMPVTLIGESVYARMVSALKPERMFASGFLGGKVDTIPDAADSVIADLEAAVYASKIVSYTQGFMLIASAEHEYGWRLDAGTIAGLWRAGCIIRSRFLAQITDAYRQNPNLHNLLLDDYFGAEITGAVPGWRRTITRAVNAGVPTPALSSALAFYDAYRSETLPANLIQAQRDYFGAHTYERVDHPRGEWFHTDWTGEGGAVTSGSYGA